MKIEGMEREQRELLLDSIDILLRQTKAAIGTNSGSFLPTTAAEEQVAKLDKAKAGIPEVDDTDRDVEIIEPLVGVCRNALVVHIRVLDRETRASEIKRKVSTRATDAKMDQLQKILAALGDERDLETILSRKKPEAPVDERQIDFTTQQDESEAVGAGAAD